MTNIAGIEKRIEDASLQTFCQNETVNLILSAFHQKADRQNIQLDIQADIPQKLSLPDADLCVIISNALENAVNATGKVTGRPRLIRFDSHTKNEQLFLEISNPYEGDVQIVNGEPQSGGEGGIGTKSIALMVKAHGGLFSFEARNGDFILSIIL